MNMKTCPKCHKELPATVECFGKDSTRKSGLRSWCKICCSESRKKYRREHTKEIRKYDKKYHLRYNFGLTLEQYDKMSTAQGNVCAICGGINSDGRRLAVDHDHKTGKVRGLLCSGCNLVAGLMGEDVTLLLNMGIYLEKNR